MHQHDFTYNTHDFDTHIHCLCCHIKIQPLLLCIYTHCWRQDLLWNSVDASTISRKISAQWIYELAFPRENNPFLLTSSITSLSWFNLAFCYCQFWHMEITRYYNSCHDQMCPKHQCSRLQHTSSWPRIYLFHTNLCSIFHMKAHSWHSDYAKSHGFESSLFAGPNITTLLLCYPALKEEPSNLFILTGVVISRTDEVCCKISLWHEWFCGKFPDSNPTGK